MNTTDLSRRYFLQFFGASAVTLSLAPLAGCTKKSGPSDPPSGLTAIVEDQIKGIAPSDKDAFLAAPQFQSELLIKWGDKLNSAGDTFGFNNDYIAFLPLQGKTDEAILWVNHEYPDPLFVSSKDRNKESSKADVDKEMYNTGGSLLHIKKAKNGFWSLVFDSKYNKRITSQTMIPFAGGQTVGGKKMAMGTLGNCAGGVTPWNTFLTCEENYQNFYGERDRKSGKIDYSGLDLNWPTYYKNEPEHYGWVVEIDPLTGKAKKHTSIGRYAHECATVSRANDGRIVVYSGDDKAGECLYKFISNSKDSLESGTLYAADTVNGKWIPLTVKNPILKKKFKNDLEILTYTREAAHMVGATELDRPEDIEFSPDTKDVFVALTNNARKKNFYGQIMKIQEKGSDHGALEFKASVFTPGGEQTGFACPDNLCFDNLGNLWVTTDMSGSFMNKFPYTKFKNNGLFYIPMSGQDAGKAIQMASAPTDAEFTGPCFSGDFKTLFLSIQHPGEKSKSLTKLTSHWPEGGSSIPRSGIMQLNSTLFT